MRRAGLQASGLLQLLVQAACCIQHLDAGLPHLCGIVRRVNEHHKKDAAAATSCPDAARLLRLAMSAALCICVRCRLQTSEARRKGPKLRHWDSRQRLCGTGC